MTTTVTKSHRTIYAILFALPAVGVPILLDVWVGDAYPKRVAFLTVVWMFAGVIGITKSMLGHFDHILIPFIEAWREWRDHGTEH